MPRPRTLPAAAWLLAAATAAAQAPPPAAPALFPFPLLGRAAKKVAVTDPKQEDEKAMAGAGLKQDDAAGLIAYFMQRTLSDADLEKIRVVIRRMGDERFEERLKAAEEAETFGPAAVGPLRAASQSDADPEVAYRAGETLKRIEKVPHARVSAAAARALARLAPPDAARVLLGFLPMADTPAVEEDVRAALEALAVRGGAVDPALVAGLTDANATRRGAAAVSMVAAATRNPSGPAAALLPKLRALAREEKEPDARFRVGFALATAARDADAIAGLIDLLPDLAAARGRLWQVEDVLLQVAGEKAPKAKLGPDRAALETARSAWKAWWDAAKGSIDLPKFTYRPRTTGRLALMLMDQPSGYGNGRLVQLGPDLRTEWRVNGIMSPADFQITPAGRIWVVETTYNRITERDERGKILQTWPPPQGQPVGFQVLDDGHILVANPMMVAEYDSAANWKELRRYNRPQSDIRGVKRWGAGPTFVLTGNNTQPTVVRLDENWKELARPQRLASLFYQPKLDVVGPDRFLVTEQAKVVEYDFGKPDLKPGEGVWSVPASNPTAVERLPNGNTLIVELGTNTLKEVTPEKETVWTYTPTDGQRVFRVQLR